MASVMILKTLQNRSNKAIGRLQVCVVQRRGLATATHPLLFRFTPCLTAEPIKKKRRADVQLTADREKRKIVKIERAMVKLLERGRRLKPVEELQGYYHITKTLHQRIRNPPELTKEAQAKEEIERDNFLKDWTAYHSKAHSRETKIVSKALSLQKKALEALREESEELYQLAIQRDQTLLPWVGKGPSYTPSNKHYKALVGEVHDVSDKFDRTYVEIEVSKSDIRKGKFSLK